MKNIEDVYELSALQEGILFHSQYDSQSDPYIVQISCIIEGDFNVAAFKQTWQTIIARHSILRTAFYWKEADQPLQVVYKEVELPWEEHDWQNLSSQNQQEQFETFLQKDRNRLFEFSTAPLMRLILIQMSQTKYQFVWDSHHILLDGWSIALLFQEIFAFYKALCEGQHLSLDEPRRYRDYIVWLQHQDLSKAAAFWKEKLKGRSTPTSLDMNRAVAKSFEDTDKYKEQRAELLQDTTASLQSFVKQYGLTLNTLVQGAWALLLSHYSGETDVIYGATVSGRTVDLDNIDSMVGLFINTLPMRVHLFPELTVLDWLNDLQSQQMEIYQHEHVPLVQIQNWSEIPNRMPLFESILVFENYRLDTSVLKEEQSNLELYDVRTLERTNYPLRVEIEPNEELSIIILYDGSRFDDELVSQILRHFQRFLEGMISNPKQLIGELPTLTDAERYQVLVKWNDTGTDYPRHKCIHELFEEQAQRTPDAIAVVFEEQQLTYDQLNRRANQVGHYLQVLGVGPNIFVGICVERSIEMIVGLLGILKAGGAYLPLDPSFPNERLLFMLEDAQPRALLIEQHLLKELPIRTKDSENRQWYKIPVSRTEIGNSILVCMDTDWKMIATYSDTILSNGLACNNMAYLIYTSGSTGQPKGVQVPHVALTNHLYAMQERPGFRTRDVLLAVTTLSFDIAGLEIYLPLITGGRVVIAPYQVATDGRALATAVEDVNATVMQATPATWRMMFDAGWVGNRNLKVLCGGEALPPDLAEQLLACSGELWNMFGPTETTIWSVAKHVRTGDKKISVGHPIANTEVYVLDAYLQPAPVGVPGELYIGGEGLALGYFNRPELTAEKFIPHPFSHSPGGRLYKTGDLTSYQPDGNIVFLGRSDHQIKLRGYRIELGEIEAVLARHHDIREVVVTVNQATDDKQLVAYFVPQLETVPELSQLRAYLSTKLPEFMVPTHFVPLSAFPLTSNGKLDRQALPKPDQTDLAIASYVAPRRAEEEVLASIWADVLGLKQVGIYDNFFDLGGHSLLATQLVSRICQAFQVKLTTRNLFEDATTVYDMGQLVDMLRRAGQELPDAPILPVERNQRLPLSFAQHGLWFLNQLEPTSALYNIPTMTRLRGQLDLAALGQSFKEIIKRHEILRTTLASIEGEVHQEIHPTPDLVLPLVDLQSIVEYEQEREVQRLVAKEAELRFDLNEGPLVRTTLIHLNENESVLILSMHHVVADAWSVDILIREMTALYHAYRQGGPSPLLELPIQYADFAHWQHELIFNGGFEPQITYWKQQLAGELPILDLPTDYPRPAVQTFGGSTHDLTLSPNLVEALKQLSRQENATLYMVLLAAFKVLLYRYSGQKDILVGAPIANRNRLEVENLIGLFVNMLVLRTNLGGNPSFQELLTRVREVTLDADAHQDVPFELLVDELQPQRDLSHAPLFQVAFGWQHAPIITLELPNLVLNSMVVEDKIAKFDLSFDLWETDKGIRGTIQYNKDLFETATIERMADHFKTLLADIVAQPGQKISELSLLRQAKRDQLLLEWNETRANYPSEQCIQELFEFQVERIPNAIAVVFETQHLTYAELNRRSNQLGHYLQTLGVGPEVSVGLCLKRSVEMVVGMLGILKAGGAYVPLDPNFPKQRLSFILADTEMKVVITERSLISTLPTESVTCVLVNEEIWRQKPIEKLDISATGDSLAYIIYTSGSTGIPKGVMVAHRAVNRLVTNTDYLDFTTVKTIGQASTASFDAVTFEIWGALLNGTRLVIVETQVALSPSLLAMQIARDKIDTLFLTTALFNQIAAAQADTFTGMHYLLFGGEAVDPQAVNRIMTTGKPDYLLHVYGPTESTTYSTWYEVTEVLPNALTIPIGRAISNTQIYVLDEEMAPIPIGLVGELYIGGDGLARNYLNQPELTAEKFVPHPFSHKPGERLYKTGDLVRYQSDKNVVFLGRSDQQVKVRGYRIELGEIEAVLECHPDVCEVVVIVQDETGDKQLVAYLISRSKRVPNASQLRDYLSTKLPQYMVPAYFILLDTFPLTLNGKLDLQALSEYTPSPMRENFVAPRDSLELELTHIWEDILGHHPIGIGDNFLELGGHSISAVRLSARIQQHYSITFPITTVFQDQTIEELADLLRSNVDLVPTSPLVPIQPHGSNPPFFCIHPGSGNVMGFIHLAHHLGQEQPFWGLQDLGRFGTWSLDTSIEELASYYLESVRSMQPQGPYFLGGESFGGQIAFEMAQQLCRQGQSVALLAILDTPSPATLQEWGSYYDNDVLLSIMAEEVGLSIAPDDFRDLSLESKLDYGLKQMMSTDITENIRQYAFDELQIFRARVQAMQEYTPQIYSGKVTLFRTLSTRKKSNAPSDSLEDSEHVMWGWDIVSTEPVEIHFIPGKHHTMTSEPHVRVLAEKLNLSLQNAQAREEIHS